jgi:hypothetical protein
MKATCPTSIHHEEFTTVATILEEWVVDESGRFMESLGELETINEPDPENVWTCNTCGEEADVE